MIEFIKVEDEIKQILGLDLSEIIILVKKDSDLIGCGKVNKNDNSKVCLYIEEKHRGNGYGKTLFNKLLEEYKKLGFEKISICCANDDIVIKKIVTDARGVAISNVQGNVTYVIPL